MIIRDEMLQALDDYHNKSLIMQDFLFDGNLNGYTEEELKTVVDDDLVYHVPIYDMLDRRYASFCSLLEAIDKKENDPKGNGIYFNHVELDDFDFLMLCYLFRLCGSGINYIPKSDGFKGTHGFGNFWVVDELLKGSFQHNDWLKNLENLDKPFTDNKGYLLPQFSYPDISSGHLKRFVVEESIPFVSHLYNFFSSKKRDIIEVVDEGNEYLNRKGFKKQNFVLSAFCADVAEYFGNFIDRSSMIYAGTNAKKCIGYIFENDERINRLKFEDKCIRFLSERYGAPPYSVEDSRLCDPIRYFKEYQSPAHIKANGGKIYKNNSILKTMYSDQEYAQMFS